MAIDYSKWDKLEISDDSDIEVHPNVDKQSFIRWKQQDIHQKREERNQQIRSLETQVPMYVELNRRVDQMLQENDDDKLGNYQGIQEYLLNTFDGDKPEGVEEDGPTYNEMIEDLLVQLKGNLEKAGQDPNSGANLRQEIKLHRKKIDDVLVHHQDQLESLYKERDLHISSADIHTGWDRSFLNKGESKPSEPASVPIAASSSASAKASSESYSSPASTSTAHGASSPVEPKSASTESSSALTQTSTPSSQTAATSHDDEEALQELVPATIALSKIPTTNTDAIKDFLKTHQYIITPSQKDALLMSAFDAQFNGDDRLTQQIIAHSTLMQYVIDLINFKKAKYPQEIAIIVDGLFSKMFSTRSNPAKDAYHAEVERTFDHIKQRAKILSAEGAEQGEQEIQLKSLDDNTELIVNLPDPNSDDPEEKERYEMFKTLPKDMQDALKSESLDAVNEVFHGMPIEKAEEILEVFDACQVIGVQEVLENEEEWKELKNEYEKETNGEQQQQQQQQQQQVPRIEELDIQEEQFNTADIVD